MTKLKGKYRERMDRRVQLLVYIMNNLPGIKTYTSCGGHVKVTDPSQCEKDEFTVGFVLDPMQEGLSSLTIITRAIQQVDGENISINTYVYDESPEYLVFHVNGKNGASPNGLMMKIRELYPVVEPSEE